MDGRVLRRALTAALGMALVTTFVAASAVAASAATTGAVYVETNTSANSVMIFARDAAGRLNAGGSVSTGGAGTNAPLGSQGALALSDDGAYLFAVNAGSNQISSFAVGSGGQDLQLVGVYGSKGIAPISVTVHGDLLFVLNAMGLTNITGFHVGGDGSLSAIRGSTRHLSAPLPNPAEVSFDPRGSVLIVTEKGTSLIDTFSVDSQGMPGPITITPSSGIEPFGFEFDAAGHAIVSEAFGGGAGRGAASSYRVDPDASAQLISGSVNNGQTATCWVALGLNGRVAFMSNTGSGTLSSYTVAMSGSLKVRSAVAANTGDGSGPIDLALDTTGTHMFVLTPGTGQVQGFSVGAAGGLSTINAAGSLPPSTSGLAAL
jgi:6-phosphogluconolactonase (cycloisomerase 2 family)